MVFLPKVIRLPSSSPTSAVPSSTRKLSPFRIVAPGRSSCWARRAFEPSIADPAIIDPAVKGSLVMEQESSATMIHRVARLMVTITSTDRDKPFYWSDTVLSRYHCQDDLCGWRSASSAAGRQYAAWRGGRQLAHCVVPA